MLSARAEFCHCSLHHGLYVPGFSKLCVDVNAKSPVDAHNVLHILAAVFQSERSASPDVTYPTLLWHRTAQRPEVLLFFWRGVLVHVTHGNRSGMATSGTERSVWNSGVPTPIDVARLGPKSVRVSFRMWVGLASPLLCLFAPPPCNIFCDGAPPDAVALEGMHAQQQRQSVGTQSRSN